MRSKRKLIMVMGVSGCGKSTLGRALARELELSYFDGDDFHPPENVEKMSKGAPLNDTDRSGWLKRLNQLALEYRDKGAVIACSALKEIYRQTLESGLEGELTWIYLYGSYERILQRLKSRDTHFMPASLLQSQFDTLEAPEYGLHVPIDLSVEEAILEVKKHLIQS